MAAPDFAVQGALVYQTNHCNACHQIKGVGKKLGPALDGIGEHRDRAWLEKHFIESARALSPGQHDAAVQVLAAGNGRDLQVPAAVAEGGRVIVLGRE